MNDDIGPGSRVRSPALRHQPAEDSATLATDAAGTRPLPPGECGIAEVERGLDLELEVPLAPLRIGFELVGHPANPTVVVLGGISADAHMCAHQGETGDGWWERLTGPGRPVDTRSLHLVGMDWVGGPGRSSAPPAGDDPERIPAVTTGDQARALAALLDHLELDRVAAVLGASYGAMVALRFGAHYPHRTDRLVTIGGAHRSHPMATALRAIQRRIALLGERAGDRRRGVALARALAMTTYRSAPEFSERFSMAPRQESGHYRFEVEDYLEHQGEKFADRFALAPFLCLSQSLDLHTIDPHAIGAPTTLVAVKEDTLAPIWQMRELKAAMGATAELVEISSPYGHDAFLVEEETVGRVLRRVLPGSGSATHTEDRATEALRRNATNRRAVR